MRATQGQKFQVTLRNVSVSALSLEVSWVRVSPTAGLRQSKTCGLPHSQQGREGGCRSVPPPSTYPALTTALIWFLH